MSREKDKKFKDLLASAEFRRDLEMVAGCEAKTKHSALLTGQVADKWIGDSRYSRILNAEVFASAYKEVTGRLLSSRRVRNYIVAYKTQSLLEDAGVNTEAFTLSHLQEIGESKCESNEERIELARRVNEKDVPARQIPRLAERLLAEHRQCRDRFEVVTTEACVRLIDALDLLAEQEDSSIACAILDWQGTGRTTIRNRHYPQVYTAEDPVQHLCECLEILARKLAPPGYIFLFYTTVGFIDPRLPATCDRLQLKHVGKLIWHKTTGGTRNANALLRVAHEEVHILCHADSPPKPVNGGAISITSQWTAPTECVSGKITDAVHADQKPVALMDLLIKVSTVNGLVVDPYAGSGTAGIAAVRRGCRYVGSELVPEIAATANRRIALAHGENDEVVEAINFFLDDATGEQSTIIAAALKKCNLNCVRKTLEREAA